MDPRIIQRAAALPRAPGIYVFVDEGGAALYVGKAADLRARVRSYLRPGGDGRAQLRFLERQARDLEFVVTRTEQEALLLEDTVVKKRRPRFNVKLRDDKAFLMLRLDRREPWPWFRLVRRRADDGAEYFGPYASATSVRRTLRLLHKVVPLRDCRDGVFHNRVRPCLKHQIGRCPAPCVGLIDRPAYDALLDEAVDVLAGGAGRVLRRLRKAMAAAVDDLEFERAGAIQAQIAALEYVAEGQTVVAGGGDEDAVGLWRTDDEVVCAILFFRRGKLESSRRFVFPSALPDDLLLGDVLARFYHGDRFVPPAILVPGVVAETRVIADWLAEKRGGAVDIAVPKRGVRRQHLAMAVDNARLAAAAEHGEVDRRLGAAGRLADRLGLAEPPHRLHCLDVSTLQGRDTVASRVCFVAGKPHKAGYRRFRIGAEASGDDFASMAEAVRRSLALCLTNDDDELPDLLLVDGGKGQLGAALGAIEELGMAADDLCVVGLAKSRLRGVGDARSASRERLFVPGRPEPLPLEPGAAETLLVAAARDEAHRFAISYHRRVRSELTSDLDAIPGVGPARRRLLLRHFGSLGALRAAGLAELRGVPGLPERVAEAVYRGLRGARDEDP